MNLSILCLVSILLTSFRNVIFSIYFPDFTPDSRNDGNAHRVTRHFIQPSIRKTGCRCFIKLFIGKTLQPPTFNRHELSYSSVMDNPMPVLCRYCIHRLVWFFDSSALLAHFFSVGADNSSRFVSNQNCRMFPSVVADS